MSSRESCCWLSQTLVAPGILCAQLKPPSCPVVRVCLVSDDAGCLLGSFNTSGACCALQSGLPFGAGTMLLDN